MLRPSHSSAWIQIELNGPEAVESVPFVQSLERIEFIEDENARETADS